ncbi:hypothetical protein L211DRAFT_836811 [Terfezia boudieri ATCC MYA-4762]|uniref:Uncharacterized protein n=1 Tax=Terfezia boudieri ATCC MYA-4762 TaxID=1051890 RepID=A0A3N4LWD6_9PEZI|nr:hypothetical protein L211DRAFT_836811 [Terfezia boudieri ATCC MYA-4762]
MSTSSSPSPPPSSSSPPPPPPLPSSTSATSAKARPILTTTPASQRFAAFLAAHSPKCKCKVDVGGDSKVTSNGSSSSTTSPALISTPSYTPVQQHGQKRVSISPEFPPVQFMELSLAWYS